MTPSYILLNIDGKGSVEKQITITTSDPPLQFYLVAVDANNPSRQSSEGVLHMVLDSRREATITANILNGSFAFYEPNWTGQSGLINNTTVSSHSSTDESKLIWASCRGQNQSVCVNYVAKVVNQVPFGSFKKDNNLPQNIAGKLKFPGGASFSYHWNIGNMSYNSELVDMYNSPYLGWKRNITLAIDASVSGRISHPTLSGSLPGDLAIWELGAEAELSGSASGGVGVDPSSNNPSWSAQNLSANLTGTVLVEWWVCSDLPYVKLDGSISASTSVTGAGQLSGNSVQYMGSWNGITGDISIKVYNTDPNRPWVEWSGSRTLIAGDNTGWKTAFTLP